MRAARSPHGLGAPARPRELPLPRWPRAAGRGEASPRRRPSRRHVAPQLLSLRAPPWLRPLPPVRCCSACSAWCCPAAARCTPRAPCRSTPSPSTRYGAAGAGEPAGAPGGRVWGRSGPCALRPAAVPGAEAREERGGARQSRGAAAAATGAGSARCWRSGRTAANGSAAIAASSQWERGGRGRQPIGAVQVEPSRGVRPGPLRPGGTDAGRSGCSRGSLASADPAP